MAGTQSEKTQTNGKNSNIFSVENFTTSDKNPYSFEEAFELTGHGTYNVSVLLMSGLCLCGVMMESLGTGYILSSAECEFSLSTPEKGLLNSAIFIGIVVSSHLWGYLLDTKGRKGIIMPGALLGAFCSLLSSFSSSKWMLITLRIMTGFFISSSSSGIYAYVGEMHTNAYRTKAITRFSISISFALILLPALAWLIIPYKWSVAVPFLGIHYTSWRLYLVICGLPNFLGGLLLIKFPESPKFLYTTGQVEKALHVLQTMYKYNKIKLECPVTEIKRIAPVSESTDSTISSIWKQTVPLFQCPLIVCLVMSCCGQFVVFNLATGLYLWVPDILNVFLGKADENGSTLCEALDRFSLEDANITNATASVSNVCDVEVSDLVYQVGIYMGFVFCFCYFMIGLTINLIGKRLLLVIMLVICGTCTLTLYWISNIYMIMVFMVLLLCIGSAGGVTTAVAVDLFPTNLRAMAMSLSLMCGRLGAIFGANIAGIMIEKSCSNTFIVFGGITLLYAAFNVFWPKLETVKEKLRLKGMPYS